MEPLLNSSGYCCSRNQLLILLESQLSGCIFSISHLLDPVCHWNQRGGLIDVRGLKMLEAGLMCYLHTLAGSQATISTLDQALYMMSEFEDTKTLHDKWF